MAPIIKHHQLTSLHELIPSEFSCFSQSTVPRFSMFFCFFLYKNIIHLQLFHQLFHPAINHCTSTPALGFIPHSNHLLIYFFHSLYHLEVVLQEKGIGSVSTCGELLRRWVHACCCHLQSGWIKKWTLNGEKIAASVPLAGYCRL